MDKLIFKIVVFMLYSALACAQIVTEREVTDDIEQIRKLNSNLDVVRFTSRTPSGDTITDIHLKGRNIDGSCVMDNIQVDFVQGVPLTKSVKIPLYHYDRPYTDPSFYKIELENTLTDGVIKVYQIHNKYQPVLNQLKTNLISYSNGYYFPVYDSYILSRSYVLIGELTLKSGFVSNIKLLTEDEVVECDFNFNGVQRLRKYVYFEDNKLVRLNIGFIDGISGTSGWKKILHKELGSRIIYDYYDYYNLDHNYVSSRGVYKTLREPWNPGREIIYEEGYGATIRNSVIKITNYEELQKAVYSIF